MYQRFLNLFQVNIDFESQWSAMNELHVPTLVIILHKGVLVRVSFPRSDNQQHFEPISKSCIVSDISGRENKLLSVATLEENHSSSKPLLKNLQHQICPKAF